jgi:hypothetical protein
VLTLWWVGVDLLLTGLQLCSPAYGEAHTSVMKEAGPGRWFSNPWDG